VAAKRTASGVKLRISGRGTAYRVIINGRVVARTKSRAPVIRTKAARKAARAGARVRVQAVNAAGTSALSNIIRL
jgi:hypothetical protein